MSKFMTDVKGLKSSLLFVPLTYYALVIFSILNADEPKTIFYYNEMIMLPLIVMLTGLLFLRELSGTMMEIYATYPVSFARMLTRKLVLLLLITFLLHLGWTSVYLAKFETMKTMVFFYDGTEPVFTRISLIRLFLQAAPNYFFIAALTMFGLILSRRLQVGWILGFGIWMFYSLMGDETDRFLSLYTIYTNEKNPFWLNQIVLFAVAGILFMTTIMISNNRSRWIKEGEVE